MAVVDFSVEALLARVKRTLQLRGSAGGGNLKLTDTHLLEICDEEIQQNLFPQLLVVREDYQEMYTSLAFASGIQTYRIPFVASSSTFDHIDIVQLSGATVIGQWRIPRVPVPEAFHAVSNQAAGPVPSAYCVMGDVIRFVPTPTAQTAASYRFAVFHEFRPSRLIPSAASAPITLAAANGFNMNITVGSLPAAMVANYAVDIISTAPPLMPIAVTGSILSIAANPIISVFGGYDQYSTDIVAQIGAAPTAALVPSGYTCTFPLPDAWWAAAILSCSATVALNLGDGTSYQMLRAEADASIARLVALQSNRIRKEPQTIFDRSSPQRRSGGWWGGGGFGPVSL